MNQALWRKSKNHYQGGLVTPCGTSRTNEYFTCVDIESEKVHEVKLTQTPQGLTATCECMSKTFHVDKPTFCSHILSIIMYKYFHTKINEAKIK